MKSYNNDNSIVTMRLSTRSLVDLNQSIFTKARYFCFCFVLSLKFEKMI